MTLVKCDWANYKDVLALGGFDVTHHLIMYFLKPIEQGLDVKFTGGIHRGCLRVQTSTNSDIHTVEDLRGKRIGRNSPIRTIAHAICKRWRNSNPWELALHLKRI